MTEHAVNLPRHPVWPTILIMTVLAVVGGFVWWAVSFASSAYVVASSGPFAWFALGPPLIAGFGLAGSVGLVAVPLWTWAGGSFLAARAGGTAGNAAREMGVTFFSATHPIAKITQALAARMNLPPIAHIGWFPGQEINAFAMGNAQSNALIAVSQGAVERLTKEELVAVIAHELGHVASNDMARMTYARSSQEALTFFLIWRGLKTFARWIFTPLSELELLRMSRAREFTADRISAIMLGPEHMVSALERLKHETGQPSVAGLGNLMMWNGRQAGGLLDTHPSFDERIRRLREFAATKLTGPVVVLGRAMTN